MLAAASPAPCSLAPGTATYVRHHPERTVLHQVVREHLLSFLADVAAARDGVGVPAFIERELRAYLDCGILAHGFTRVRCDACAHEILVAWSCRGRSVCPSCGARRMHETAAFLVDHILPHVPYRQWVLSFPWELRLPLAFEASLLSSALRAFVGAVFAWQRRRARTLGAPLPRGAISGAVTFIQRFGSALQLTPHFHVIAPDGVFVPCGDKGKARRFVPLEPPSREELVALLERVARRVRRVIARSGRADDGVTAPDAASLARDTLSPPPSGTRGAPPLWLPGPDLLCAHDGFTLHAALDVHQNDRQGLERLCRYGLRPAISLSRLSLTTDGRVVVRMKRAFRDGRRELVLTPFELLRRLCALVAPPGRHLIRYHGVFAARAHARGAVVPPEAVAETGDVAGAAPAEPNGPPRQSRRLLWAALLRRVHAVDVLACVQCGARLRVLAGVTDPAAVRAILVHLGLPATPPPLTPARAPPQLDLAL